jgi:hypothetical protein
MLMVMMAPMMPVPILVRAPISVFVLIAALTVVFLAFVLRPAVVKISAIEAAIVSAVISPYQRYRTQRQQGGDEQCKT